MIAILTFHPLTNPISFFYFLIAMMILDVFFKSTIFTAYPMWFFIILRFHLMIFLFTTAWAVHASCPTFSVFIINSSFVGFFWHMVTTVTTFYWVTSLFLDRLMFLYINYITTIIFTFCYAISIFILTDNYMVTCSKYFLTLFT